jgi:hypothetical protein
MDGIGRVESGTETEQLSRVTPGAKAVRLLRRTDLLITICPVNH